MTGGCSHRRADLAAVTCSGQRCMSGRTQQEQGFVMSCVGTAGQTLVVGRGTPSPADCFTPSTSSALVCWPRRMDHHGEQGRIPRELGCAARMGNGDRVSARTTETPTANARLDVRALPRRKTDCGKRGLREGQFSFRKTQ
ncbi:uncharacterized protein RDI95_004905 [Morus bassanus]